MRSKSATTQRRLIYTLFVLYWFVSCYVSVTQTWKVEVIARMAIHENRTDSF